MASRASSGGAAPAKLPHLGTSWYRRGVGYWLRRAVSALVQLGFAALFGLVSVGVWRLVESLLPPGWHAGADMMMGALSLGFLVRGWVWGRRTIRAKPAAPPTPEQAWQRHRLARAGRGGADPDFGRRGGPLLFFAPLLVPCVAWWIGVTCATQFIRELPSEAGARKALTRP